MISLPSIILIDDTKEDLDTLQDSLAKIGYPCLPVHYKNDDPDNQSGIDHVNFDRVKPRVIISDLNLQEAPVDRKQLVGPIAEVLKLLPLDGPFILFFWSQNKDYVEPVLNDIYDRHPDIPYPLHWGVLDKTKFKSSSEGLTEEVENLISYCSVFDAMSSWESRISMAAQKTTDTLFNLASKNKPENLDNFREETTEKLQSMLAVIGNETLGVQNAQEEPDIAVELGLAPVLHDHISMIKRSNFWKDAAPDIGSNVNLDKEVATKLNSFCHIEEVENYYSKGCRGVFLGLSKDILSDQQKRAKLECRFGNKLENIIEEEFLVQIANKKQIKIAGEKTKIGFVEISAECDQAQKKTKLHRYVIAALTPLKYQLENGDEFDLYGKQNKKSHQGIYRVPDINLGGIDYILQLSFKYQIGALPDENSWLGNSIFRLRDQIMVDISFNCAQYISRPGIIAFK